MLEKVIELWSNKTRWAGEFSPEKDFGYERLHLRNRNKVFGEPRLSDRILAHPDAMRAVRKVETAERTVVVDLRLAGFRNGHYEPGRARIPDRAGGIESDFRVKRSDTEKAWKRTSWPWRSIFAFTILCASITPSEPRQR